MLQKKVSKETTTETIFWPDYCKVKTQMEIKWADKKSQPKLSPNSLLGLTPSQTHHAQFSTGSCMVNAQHRVLLFRNFKPSLTQLSLPARRFHHTPWSSTFHTSNAALTRACACIPHSTSAIGLPRIVAEGPGVDFDDVHFPPGTVLSVPSYTIHHLEEIWGQDVEEFKPDRWLELDGRQNVAFNPFSFGPKGLCGTECCDYGVAAYYWDCF